MDYRDRYISSFEQWYHCIPVSLVNKPHLELGDKIVMPASALGRLAYLLMDYPMLFELSNTSAGRVTHCGVLEFTADEGLIYLPDWMMEHMLLQKGDLVHIRNASLVKGTYVKLQPHTRDFLDISNPKAMLEISLRRHSCFTSGDTIMVPYNNKKYYINIVETKPSSAVSIIETDCEVDFALPLDYEEHKRPTQSKQTQLKQTQSKQTQPEDQEEPAKEADKFIPFTGFARCLDGKPWTKPPASVAPPTVKQAPPSSDIKTNVSNTSSSGLKSGKLVFGSNAKLPTNGESKDAPKKSIQEPSEKAEEPKFQAFKGKKYSLRD